MLSTKVNGTILCGTIWRVPVPFYCLLLKVAWMVWGDRSLIFYPGNLFYSPLSNFAEVWLFSWSLLNRKQHSGCKTDRGRTWTDAVGVPAVSSCHRCSSSKSRKHKVTFCSLNVTWLWGCFFFFENLAAKLINSVLRIIFLSYNYMF